MPLPSQEAVANGTAKLSWKGKEGMSDEYAAHLGRVVLVGCAVRRPAAGERRMTMKNTQHLRFSVNGEPKEFLVAPDEKLLDLLRREG